MSRGHGRVGSQREGMSERPSPTNDIGVATRHVRQWTTAVVRPRPAYGLAWASSSHWRGSKASSKLIDYHGHKLGYLQFTQFTQGSAGQLRAQVRRMLNDHAEGLILDLRDNGGGLLSQAVSAASIFIMVWT